MYDELLDKIRQLLDYKGLMPVQVIMVYKELLGEAADAIEELSKQLDDMNEANIALYGALPKWIPVTERLPEDDTAVLTHVYWPEYGDTMVCYGHWHKGWCHLFHHVEGELISGYVVTHWMPLPEPPKEES